MCDWEGRKTKADEIWSGHLSYWELVLITSPFSYKQCTSDPSPVVNVSTPPAYFNGAWTSLMVNQVFDYLITIEDEWKARWIWGRSWNATRVIFTVSRYVPFLGTGLTAYYHLCSRGIILIVLTNLVSVSLDSPSSPCPAGLQATENVIHIIGVIAAELLLVLRTYALWLGDKRLLYGLLSYVVVTICAAIAIDTIATQFLPGEQPPLGCLLESPSNGALVYGMLLLFEIVIFALITYKSFGASRGTRSSVLTPEKAITLANVIITFWLPASCVFNPHVQKADSLTSQSIATSWISGGSSRSSPGSAMDSGHTTSSASTGSSGRNSRSVRGSCNIGVDSETRIAGLNSSIMVVAWSTARFITQSRYLFTNMHLDKTVPMTKRLITYCNNFKL
ncbi:hypothetical protein BU15DRAFT_63298 [Melanogaster broomeanus]|nr:hypothetical protein BU15DRAFT_63298 [Melanogaster broomeanus]